MRQRWLLMVRGDETGSAVIETVAAMAILMLLVLGAMQVALALYARNVVSAAAHEGARSAIELGRAPREGGIIAEDVVRQAAGGIARELAVESWIERAPNLILARVRVRAVLKPIGPIPVSIPVTATAAARREIVPR